MATTFTSPCLQNWSVWQKGIEFTKLMWKMKWRWTRKIVDDSRAQITDSCALVTCPWFKTCSNHNVPGTRWLGDKGGLLTISICQQRDRVQLPLLPGTACTARQERCRQQVKGNHAGEGAGVVRLHNSVPEPFTCRVGREHLLWSFWESFPYCSAVCDIKNFLFCHHCTDPLKAFHRYLSNSLFLLFCRQGLNRHTLWCGSL